MVAHFANLTRTYYSQVESGLREPSARTKEAIECALNKLSPEYDMYVIFDYVRIRFKTHDLRYIIESVLKMQPQYFWTEDFGFYGYSGQYLYGSICVMTSDEDDERETLLELKGCGCREFENVLDVQNRSWLDFFSDCIAAECSFKRIDLAINDTGGILSIPELIEKCKNDECNTIFKSYQSNASGEMYGNEKLDGKADMGSTLYIGSLKSDIYFCIYEKDYEQYRKEGIPLEEADVKNRFEIRLKNDRVLTAVEDLISYGDVEKTAFEIINNYVCFYDADDEKNPDKWEINARWLWFMGNGRNKLRLTVQPEPYTFDKTVRWLVSRVLPSLKTALKLDLFYDRDIINKALQETDLPEKHKRLLKQLTLPLDDVIIPELSVGHSSLNDMDELLYDMDADEQEATRKMLTRCFFTDYEQVVIPGEG